MARAIGYFATFPVQSTRSRFASRWPADRSHRRAALKTIFDELQIRGLAERKAFLRELVRLDVRYRAMRGAWDEAPTKPKLRAWLKRVAKHPGQLLEMLGGKASPTGLSIIANILGVSGTDLILALAEDQSGTFKSRLADAAAKAAEQVRSTKSAGRDPELVSVNCLNVLPGVRRPSVEKMTPTATMWMGALSAHFGDLSEAH
jgi:hypothetical protein